MFPKATGVAIPTTPLINQVTENSGIIVEYYIPGFVTVLPLTVTLQQYNGSMWNDLASKNHTSNPTGAFILSSIYHTTYTGNVDIRIKLTVGGISSFSVAFTTLPAAPPPPTPASIEANIDVSPVTVGQNSSCSAIVKDSGGNPIAGPHDIYWVANSPSIATINSSTGVITTLQTGAASFYATGYSLNSNTAHLDINSVPPPTWSGTLNPPNSISGNIAYVCQLTCSWLAEVTINHSQATGGYSQEKLILTVVLNEGTTVIEYPWPASTGNKVYSINISALGAIDGASLAYVTARYSVEGTTNSSTITWNNPYHAAP